MEVFCKSDIGIVRTENQDSFGYNVITPDCAWALVCDGMGGANGGSTASTMAVKVITDAINNGYSDEMSQSKLSDFLIEAVAAANKEVFDASCADITLTGMGTTCDLVLVKKGVIHIVHVGDSRVYAVRGDRIKQLSEDHSVVMEMVRRGDLTLEQAANHPNRNFITRALGIKPHVHIDYIEAGFEPSDVLVLCSDGLSNELSDDEILQTIIECNKDEAATVLVQKAIDSGGHDNITVAVMG
ncbi:MAG: Stp1/IreP family PP2C-type Ser/Thr phosphatase [Oscillospiraceae bacterium]|nr:Stp1/IreP family PP2C-type Ser/Thr phosphatase [Oscillospiraceae bacterium]